MKTRPPNTLTFDIETFQFRKGNKLPRAVAIAFKTGRFSPEVCSFFYDRESIERNIRQGLKDDTYMFVNHNLAFDMAILANEFPDLLPLIIEKYEKGLCHCTQVDEKLYKIAMGRYRFDEVRNIRPRFSLEELVREYFNNDISQWKKDPEAPRANYHTVAHLPVSQWPEAFVTYAKLDVNYAERLYEVQTDRDDELAADGQPWCPSLEEFILQNKSAFDAQVVSATGLRRDPEAIDRLEAYYQSEIDAAMPELIEVGVYRKKKNGDYAKSMKRLQELVEEAYDGNPPTTEKGNISTSAETLAATDHPTLNKFAGVASIMASMNKDIPLLRDHVEYPLTYRVNSLLITGRWSTSSPNVQNFPRVSGVRECFIPREGRVFCSVDYDSLEVRAWARACMEIIGYSTALERYLEDPHWDPYVEHLTFSLGLPYQKILAGKSDTFKNDRTRAKPIVLGCPGGMGVDTLIESAKGYGVNFTWEEANHEREIWRECFPEGKELLDWASYVSSTHGVVRLDWVGGRARGGCGYSETANYTFQGPASNGAKEAGWELLRATQDSNSPLYGSTKPTFAHDEWIMGHYEEVAHEAAMEQVRIMTECMERTLEVPITCEAALMRSWSKKAFPAFDESGRLIPFEDYLAIQKDET